MRLRTLLIVATTLLGVLVLGRAALANGNFEKGEYVRIGVLNAGDNDKANFSPGEATFTSCNGETPNLDVLEGNFVVEEDV